MYYVASKEQAKLKSTIFKLNMERLLCGITYSGQY